MRRTWILALGLLVAPATVSAQVELGLDFFGFDYTDEDGAADAAIGISLPVSGLRVGFPASPTMIIETRMDAGYFKQGDVNGTSITLVPGLNFLVNPQIYVRGEAGLDYAKVDTPLGGGSSTQYLFGGAVGTRRPLGGGGALLRLEAGVVKGLENTDDGVPGTLIIHASVGVSAVIN